MQAWDNFLTVQTEELGSDNVQKWLKPLKVTHFDACNLYLEAKDSFQVLWFEEHVRKIAQSKFVNNNNKQIKVHLALANNQEMSLPKGKKGLKTTANAGILPSFNLTFNDPDPHCTFEYFKIADSNQLAFTLLCESTGAHEFLPEKKRTKGNNTGFNPIYVYGGTGSGKSHLLSAAAHGYKKQGLSVIFAHAETFTEHVVTAIRAGAMSTFRQAYRNIDVLIIDDVHVFSRKGATQEEFFHTFNTLHLAGKQILLSANCSPQDLQLIEPRLVSRFEWGITLPLEPLQREDVAGLLQAKAAAFSFEVPPKVVDFLLTTFKSSTKAVTKALEALILRSHMDARDRHTPLHTLTVPVVKHWLEDLIAEEEQTAVTPEKIVQSVAEYYGLRSEDLLGKAQTRECVLPRQVAMFLCREKLGMPFARIGDLFAKDHSTVMSSVKQVYKNLESPDKTFTSSLSKILKKLHTGQPTGTG